MSFGKEKTGSSLTSPIVPYDSPAHEWPRLAWARLPLLPAWRGVGVRDGVYMHRVFAYVGVEVNIEVRGVDDVAVGFCDAAQVEAWVESAIPPRIPCIMIRLTKGDDRLTVIQARRRFRAIARADLPVQCNCTSPLQVLLRRPHTLLKSVCRLLMWQQWKWCRGSAGRESCTRRQ